MEPEIGYAPCDGGYVAYSVSGVGELDVLYMSGFLLSIAALDGEPHSAEFIHRLAGFGRLVCYDRRGIGMSDPLARPDEVTVASLAEEAVSVLDAVGVRQAVVVADSGSAPPAIELATSHPDRVAALVLINATARYIAANDYPIGFPPELIESFLAVNPDPAVEWSVEGDDDLALLAPSLADDTQFRRWWTRESRRAASPVTARRLTGLIATADVRHRLSDITAPTLVLNRSGNQFVPVAHGRYLADHIAGSRFVELPGRDNLPAAGDVGGLVDEIEDFLVGRRTGDAERVLVTLVFTDIVESTARATVLGDRTWTGVLDSHDAAVRAELVRYSGREVNTTGDGFVAVFDIPTQAIRGAGAIVSAAGRAGVEVRVGVHVGECELRGRDVAGVAVHIAARIMSLAAPGEVWVSRTVVDIVAGSGIEFVPRGQHTLRGLESPRALFAVTPTGHPAADR